MATLNLELDPSGVTSGAKVAESALDGVAREAKEAELALESAGGKGGAALSKTAKTAKAATKSVSGASGALRGMSMQLSQVAQQGAATGNYLQALVIQAPDLALGFGTLGIVAGALVPILYGVGQAYFGASEEAKDLSEILDDLTDATNRYKSATDRFASGDIAREYGKMSAQALALLDIERERARIQSDEAIKAATRGVASELGVGGAIGLDPENIRIAESSVKALRSEIDKLESGWRDLSDAEIQGRIAAIDALDEEADGLSNVLRRVDDLAHSLGITESEALEVAARFAEIGEADGPRAQADAMIELVGYISDASDNLVDAQDEGKVLYDQLLQAVQAALDFAAVDMAKPIREAVAASRELALAQLDRTTAQGQADRALYAGAQASMREGLAAIRYSPDGRIFPLPKPASAGGGGGGGARASAIDRTKESYDRLRASVDDTAAAELRLANAQKTVDSALQAGHISAQQAKDTIALVKAEIEGTDEAAKGFSDTVGGVFDGIIDGSMSAKEALGTLILEFARMKAMQGGFGGSTGSIGSIISQSLFGGGLFGGGGFAGFFDNGGLIPGGSSGVVGENGPEIVTSTSRGAQVTSRNKTASMMGGGAQILMGEIVVTVDGEGMVKAYVERMGLQAAQAGRQGAVTDVQRNFGSMAQAYNLAGAVI